MEKLKYVFISHKNIQPDQDITLRMYEYLSENKLAAWYDNGIRAGGWAEQISKKLHGATAYVLVASKASLKSEEVIDEIGLMRGERQKNGKVIIPFIIDDYYFNMEEGEADYYLGSNRNQAVVLNKFQSEEDAFNKLTDYLKDFLDIFENNFKDFVIDSTHKILKKYNGSDSIVAVPRCVAEIADNAFCFNNGLEKVKIPPSVKVIGKRAFFGCENLVSAEGMQGVESCDITAFDRTRINLGESDMRMLNGVLFGGQPPEGCTLVIPKGTRVIATRAFSCINAREIIFPEGLEHIGIRAFVDCCEIEEVKFPESLKSIGAKAFEGCIALKRAIFAGKIPSNVSEAFDEKVEITGDNQ